MTEQEVRELTDRNKNVVEEADDDILGRSERKDKTALIKWLTVTHIVTLLLLLLLTIHYRVPQKIFNRLFNNDNAGRNYSHYEVRNSLFNVYAEKRDGIVMLGDSITEYVEWNELLGITNVVNRGIAGDTTEGVLQRLDAIYTLAPNICFIMIGINDISRHIHTGTIITNYKAILQGLLTHDIPVVCQTTLYVSTNVFDFKNINKTVDELNDWLKSYCRENMIPVIDTNSELACGGVDVNEMGGGG